MICTVYQCTKSQMQETTFDCSDTCTMRSSSLLESFNLIMPTEIARCSKNETIRPRNSDARPTMERNGLLTQPPGVEPIAADGDGRRIPLLSIPHHTLILLARASAPYSLPRPRNGNVAHASRSDGPRNLLELQALHPVQPSALVLYCSDFTLTLLHTGRSLDHRNPTGAQRISREDLGFRLYVAAIAHPPPSPTHPHPSHTRTH